jgi:IclR family transcriptional regulator, KDG regulon repressor
MKGELVNCQYWIFLQIYIIVRTSNCMKLIQSIMRAARVLEVVSQSTEGVRLKDIASELHLGSSTVYNIAYTLCQLNLLRQDDKTNKYQLGFRTLQLGNRYLDSLSLYNIAQPVVMELVERFNESFYLTILEGHTMLPLIRIESTHSVRATRTANAMANAHATAMGKVLLASFSQEELHRYIREKGPLEKYTVHTIATEEALIAELAKVRREGYALDLEESELGINCMSTPIRNHRTTVIAALGTSIPTQRYSQQVRKSILPHLKKAGQNISTELGFHNGGANST